MTRPLRMLLLALLSVSFICAKPQKVLPTIKVNAPTDKTLMVEPETTTLKPDIPVPPTVGPTTNVEECKTPFGKTGMCIPLRNCYFLLNMLRRKPLLEENKVFLKHSQCGYANNTVLVCCTEEQVAAPEEALVGGVAAAAAPAIPSYVDKLALLPGPKECGKMLSNRLYGGYRTDVDAFPWMVLLEYSKGENQTGLHCGGALISSRYVVTAAHCITALPSGWSLRQVRLGEWDTSIERDCNIYDDHENCASAHIDIPVESVVLHDGYVSASEMRLHDLALIRLATSVNFTDFIQPVCLPVGENILHAFYGQGLDIAGWGATPEGTFSTMKQKFSGSVLSFNDCNQRFTGSNVQLDPSQFCIEGRLINDTCRIDSGGPAMSFDTSNRGLGSFYLAGIHSFGVTCGMTPGLVLYTRIYDYLEWILNSLQP